MKKHFLKQAALIALAASMTIGPKLMYTYYVSVGSRQ